MFREFVKELNGNRVEGELVKTILYSLLTSFIILVILYYISFRYTADFIPKYGLYLFLIVLSYALISAMLRQVRSYKEMPCMSGMMVGMTSGMIAGFLPGFYVGATNGIFYGSVFGMVVGISLGIYNGKCCGIMGVMEGIMAGFMGALMGAMTVLMTLNDHLKEMAVIVFIVGGMILINLNYMIYKEMRESERQRKEDNFFTIAFTLFLIIITVLFMLYGPRGGVLG